MKPRTPPDSPTADAADLPVSWAVERDDRPCDRCPGDAVDVVWYGGREYALCADCRRRVRLGR